ncbi:MAG TPA: ABC transporter permease [Ferruginibacter sp.]|nr:ABC transporter permease [Ferruginibacter sp.]
MLKNYFTLAWRNIRKHRFYSFVNITGLFAGIVFAMLIGVYVWQELQVNKELRNAKQQYFLQSEWKGQDARYAITTLGPLARQLKENYPGLVANYYRWDGITSGVTKGDKSFREGIQLGDSTLLSMYGFDLLHGNPATALKDPYSVVMTEATAMKYFGKTAVIGESLTIQSFSGGKREFAVTGVLKNIHENSVTNFNENNNNALFIPTAAWEYFGRTGFEDWNNLWLPSFIELKEGASIAALNKAVNQLIQTHASDGVKASLTVHAVQLSDYYLHKNNALVKRMMYAVGFAGLFILLMAIVNFINIAIGNSGNRIKEIGVRKVMGSMRSHLVMQFLAESVIIVLLATILATAAYPLAKNIFASMVGKPMPSLTALPGYFLFTPLLLSLLIGLLAGIYPALVLSSLKAVDSLKGKLKTANEKIWLRKSLVGFQFSIALIVLIAAAVVAQQVNHFFNSNLGYNREYVVASQVPRDWSREGVQKMKTIRDEFAAMPQVSAVSISYEIPNGMNGNDPMVFKSGTDSSAAVNMQSMVTDENYLDVYGIKMAGGGFFDNRQLDSGQVVLSEKAVAALGFKTAAAAIGQQLRIPGDPTVFTVKGVTNDFHFNSMQMGLRPMIFFNVYNGIYHRYLSFKLKPGNAQAAVEAIQKKWSAMMPGSSFEYTFMDDALKKMYTSELQTKRAAYTAAVLSLIIALLGVLGLVSLSIHKRVKEIGIRKVLGASIQSILLLFVKEFAGILLVAGAVACPVAYLLMNNWLNNYASHIALSAALMMAAVGLLAAVTILLICLHAAKTAIANPVKSLRAE